MKLGLNLSFAVKRWLEPEVLAKMCKNDFGIDNVQFSWDIIDPWWPEAPRNKLGKEFAEAFAKEGVEIGSSFGGTASYTYAQLLAPTETQREISMTFFKRAIDLAYEMGVDVIGTPLGGMSYNDARNQERRDTLYNFSLGYLERLAAYGKKKGLREIQIEATPLITEFPHSPEVSVKLMKDLDGKTDIPIRLLIDWGHALYKSLLKEKADMELWLRECKPYVTGIHLQQTDGKWDRHWPFTRSEGIITADLIKSATKNSGADDIIQYLEVVTIFEDDDDSVYREMKQSMDFLHQVFND